MKSSWLHAKRERQSLRLAPQATSLYTREAWVSYCRQKKHHQRNLLGGVRTFSAKNAEQSAWLFVLRLISVIYLLCVFSGALSHLALEGVAEIGLRGEAAFSRYARERPISSDKKIRRALDPLLLDVLMKRSAGSALEAVVKMYRAEICVCRNGASLDFSEEKAKEILLEKEIEINVVLSDGDGSATAWGCDLTYDYVKINGDYRT